MNWLARLKKAETSPEKDATKPQEGGFVGFVASISAPIQKIEGVSAAANEPAQPLGLDTELPVFRPELVAEWSDPDRWAWPHSQAMTGREIDAMVERTSLFNRRGLPALEAELLADKLVSRDREGDDRRLCLECAHLGGWASAWRCNQWQRAGMGAAGIPAGLVLVLQRCDGFKDLCRKRKQ